MVTPPGVRRRASRIVAQAKAVLIRIHFRHFRYVPWSTGGRLRSKQGFHSEIDRNAGSTAKGVLTLAMDSPSC
jgi:hypothetical protein